ncbi:MAG: apolipoprotein N-acyltransferase [Oscillatoriales cyanobacterium]|nr:MAG: apolipoprotein N-acyltransferase [Oscillatoriales cyanobacterium]
MYWTLIQTFLGGILTGLAAEPFGCWWLAWVGLVPLWWQVRGDRQDVSLRSAALIGLTWGLGFDGLTLHWILGIHPLAWMGVPWLQSLAIALFCWVAITLVGASPVLLWAIGVRWLDRWTRRRISGTVADLWLVLAGAGLWSIAETLLSQGALWWPWLSLTQSPHNLAILQLDRLSGPTVTSATIVVVNGLLALGWRSPTAGWALPRDHRRRWYGISAISLWVALHGLGWVMLDRDLGIMHTRTIPAQSFSVGLIQGNIPNEIKLYPGGIRQALLNYRDGYLALTDPANPVDVVFTPETALPLLWSGRRDGYSPEGLLGQAIVDRNVPIWLGTIQGTPRVYTNSLLTINGKLETLSRYDKVRLVPLGEYIPFASILGRVIDILSPLEARIEFGDRDQTFDTPFGRAAVAICYESAFPDVLRRQVAAGAQFALSAANNAHYAKTMPSQHHAQDVMRAIELDRPMARATNTGYSAIVDHQGRTLWKSGLNRYETHSGVITPRTTLTPYVRWGNWLAPLSGLTIILSIGVMLAIPEKLNRFE